MWNPFRAIGRAFKTAAVFVGRTFVKLFGSDVARQFAAVAEDLLKSQLGRIVWKIVNELAAQQMSNAGKRIEALRRIGVEAKRAGLDVKESLIAMLIEIAVQRVKGEFGDPPAAHLSE